jgi:O-acetyl-ADP-ribose deacetylase (regulator of RNase III)
VEDDTYMVLGADVVVEEEHEPVDELLDRAARLEPKSLGAVVVTDKFPLLLHAIVHDLGREPTCREEWVASALDTILRESEKRKLKSLALPMLGVGCGSLAPRRVAQLLGRALSENAPLHLRHVWLATGDLSANDADELRRCGFEISR